MDLLGELRRLVGALHDAPSVERIRAAVQHINVAERHLERGRRSRDDSAYNDVVYRTNQAFEGMLKEAYSVLVGPVSKSLTAHQIEKKLIDGNVLTSRVNIAVSRYRQEWRNPSTHDHTLFFTEQDAILAIVSVSAFAVVLLGQVVEVASARRQAQLVEERRAEIESALQSYDSLSFPEKISTLLMMFAESMVDVAEVAFVFSDVELLGLLSGFITAVDAETEVQISATLGSREVDLLVRRGEYTAPIEVKRGSPQFLRVVADRLSATMAEAQLAIGFVFVPPSPGHEVVSANRAIQYVRNQTSVRFVAPENIDVMESPA